MGRKHYNTIRPHSSPGYRPPAPEAIPVSCNAAAAGPPFAALRAGQQQEETVGSVS